MGELERSDSSAPPDALWAVSSAGESSNGAVFGGFSVEGCSDTDRLVVSCDGSLARSTVAA